MVEEESQVLPGVPASLQPFANHIERLWHKLHETITRNHQCRGMANLLARLKHFMDTVSPFPGMAMAQRRCSTIGISYLVVIAPESFCPSSRDSSIH